jgi:hypothetical protein
MVVKKKSDTENTPQDTVMVKPHDSSGNLIEVPKDPAGDPPRFKDENSSDVKAPPPEPEENKDKDVIEHVAPHVAPLNPQPVYEEKVYSHFGGLSEGQLSTTYRPVETNPAESLGGPGPSLQAGDKWDYGKTEPKDDPLF